MTVNCSPSNQTQQGVRHLEIDASSADQRLDNYLIKILKGAPKSLIYKIIRKGEVRINKGRAKPESRLSLGDIVRIPPVKIADKQQPAAPGQSLIQTLKEAILYESEALLIVNKPSGLAVHGGSGVSLGLIEALRSMQTHVGFLELVHRLDRDTSGCIMVAKKRRMLTYLQDLLREEGRISKDYYALVHGQWSKRKTLVDAPLLKKEPRNGERFVEVNAQSGKASRTQFSVVERFDTATLVQARPLTGRTHQIRVHAKHVGHALVGDSKYGDEQQDKAMRQFGIKRLFLHAAKLHIPMSDGTVLTVEAPLPKALQQGLTSLRNGSDI